MPAAYPHQSAAEQQRVVVQGPHQQSAGAGCVAAAHTLHCTQDKRDGGRLIEAVLQAQSLRALEPSAPALNPA